MTQKYVIIKDITISNQDNSGQSVVVSFGEGEVVSPDAYLLPQIENLVAKGLAERFEEEAHPPATEETKEQE